MAEVTRRRFLAGIAAATTLAACRSGGGTGDAGATTSPPGATSTSAITTSPTTTSPAARSATTVAPPTTAPATTTRVAAPPLPGYPFTLGVASGDPTERGVVLWTRLVPAEAPMPEVAVPVRWQVAEDERMTRVVAEGVATAEPAAAHSVHVDVTGLAPDRRYWYRFAVGDAVTDAARTRTAPAADATTALRFGSVSCQDWSDGYYAAYDDVAGADLDLVVHLGDYIYEHGVQGRVRRQPGEATDLATYRARYALVKGDASLQRAHAACPFVVAWDDHEVVNDYQGGTDPAGGDPAAFAARRSAAYQAWWEHMPVRLARPTGPALTVWRELAWGRLARLLVLDTRSERDRQVCGRGLAPTCAAGAGARMTSDAQLDWITARLRDADRPWTVLANQVVFSELRAGLGADAPRNLDAWDGYPRTRFAVVDALVRRPADTGVAFLTGDIHASAVADVIADPADTSARTLAAEFVTPAVSSAGDLRLAAAQDVVLALNPWFRWAEATRNGWVRGRLTAGALEVDYRLLDATDPQARAVTASSWTAERGQPVAQR